MPGLNRSVVAALLTISVAGCGGSDSADSTTPASTALSTTTLPASDRLFVVDPSDLDISAANITEITKKLADSFNGFDQDAAAPLAGPGFQAIDPVYPELGFSSITGYYSYLSGLFDSSETVREIVVNADGSLTRVDWPTFFRTEPAGFDGPLRSARHLLIDEGRVSQLMHLFEQGDAATDLAARWSAAWTAHDPTAVEALGSTPSLSTKPSAAVSVQRCWPISR